MVCNDVKHYNIIPKRPAAFLNPLPMMIARNWPTQERALKQMYRSVIHELRQEVYEGDDEIDADHVV